MSSRDAKKVFYCESARATVYRDRCQVYQVSYQGVLSSACFDNLRAEVLRATRHASALFIRMDRSLATNLHMPPVPAGIYHVNAAPGVVIVRADQEALWDDYAAKLAAVGIKRLVFLDSQVSKARHFLKVMLSVRPAAAGQPRA